jgi:hypothetical protein
MEGKYMDATLKVRNRRAVVSVDHQADMPYDRAQRIATREFNQYRKEHSLHGPWALRGKETHDTGGHLVSTNYTYIEMR